MHYAVVHTTYGRPEMATEAIENVAKTFSLNGQNRMDYYLATQTDDPRLPDYRSILDSRGITKAPWFHYHELPSKGGVEGTNMIAAKVEGDWDVMVNQADDLRFCQNWDVQLSQAVGSRMDRDFVIAVYDGHTTPLITIPIVGRDYYKRMGKVFYEGYHQLYADLEFTDVATIQKVIIQARHIRFQHNHPQLPGTNAKVDAMYMRKWSSEPADLKIYRRRQAEHFGLPK